MYQTMKPVYQSAFFMRIIETLELLIKSVHQFYNTILLINIQYTHIIGMCVDDYVRNNFKFNFDFNSSSVAHMWCVG